jgi:pSer/pThr/pTyr-binding forkhead associated (FHA) protein
MPHPSFAIRFLSGRLEGGVVPLEPGCTLIIGRQPGADLLLTEDLVSRRHARLDHDGAEVVIEDLGSTNGTFVNGTRVDRARLREGDRVLVGESIFSLVPHDPARVASATEVHSLLERAVITAEKRPASAIQGRLDEVSLHDLLQLFASGRKTGLLRMRSNGQVGEIRLERGRVTGCVLDARADLPAHKALFRLFGWTSGTFELRHEPPAEAPAAGDELAESTDALLMEGARQLDELRRLRDTLPACFARADAPAAGLDDDDRAVLEAASRLGTLEAVLDATPSTDLAAAERLAKLLAAGLLVPVAPPARAGSAQR